MPRLVVFYLEANLRSFFVDADVNECEQFQIDCGHDRACFNTRGAYECIDVPCPQGYIRENRTDCLLQCSSHLTSCSHRRAVHVRYRFLAVSRLTPSNAVLFRLPSVSVTRNSTTILVDRNHLNGPLPFHLDGSTMKNDRSLTEANEYELEIHSYLNDSSRRTGRRRLHTIFIVRVNVSPFDF